MSKAKADADSDSRALEGAVADHYDIHGLEAKILGVLQAQGADLEALRLEDLAPMDEFHIGGRQATVELAAQLGLAPEMRLLDIGCGIGGAARYVASAFGCHVTGIDLTPGFIVAAAALSRRVGLADRVDFRQASALALPFADGSFDGAYTLHAAMNIADRPRLYAEARRVLKPGAPFAVYDVLHGPVGGGPHFPVPWANDASSSFLVDPDALRALLEDAGFAILATRDRTGFGLEFFAEMQKRVAAGLPTLGRSLLMGPDFAQRVANMVRSMTEGRVAPWEFICRRR
jgi:ubiquinone/menaquinone biosynthesis C-methylase UbiE